MTTAVRVSPPPQQQKPLDDNDNDSRRLEGFEWPEPKDDEDRMIQAHLRGEQKVHIKLVGPTTTTTTECQDSNHEERNHGNDEQQPQPPAPSMIPFAYTVGLYANFGHPELIVLGLDDLNMAGGMLNVAAFRIGKEGARYEAGQVTGDVCPFFEVKFGAVHPDHNRTYHTYCRYFYRDTPFPTLQIVWPGQKEEEEDDDDEHDAQQEQPQGPPEPFFPDDDPTGDFAQAQPILAHSPQQQQ